MIPTLRILQLFHPQDRRVVVIDKGNILFSSRDNQFGSFIEAAQYVKKNYSYSPSQIEALRNQFYSDWEVYDDNVWW